MITIEIKEPYGPATVSFDSEGGVVITATEPTKSFVVKALASARDSFGRHTSDKAIEALDLYLKLKKLFGADSLSVLTGESLIKAQAKAFVEQDKKGVLT